MYDAMYVVHCVRNKRERERVLRTKFKIIKLIIMCIQNISTN